MENLEVVTRLYLVEMTSRKGARVTYMLQQWQLSNTVKRALEIGHKVHSVVRVDSKL